MSARCPTRLIASPGSWIEGEAIRQLEQTAELPGMILGVGLPDLHPGRGAPIGAAFASAGILYPHLVGSDIGCGMGLWQTDLRRRKAKRDRWAARLAGLEAPWDGDVVSFLAEQGASATSHDAALGTIGGGNHFAELQQVDKVGDEAAFAALGLSADRLFLLVHSGSRGLGDAILREHADRHGAGGLAEGSTEAVRYLERHDRAVAWGRANRALIARRFLEQLSAEGVRVLDLCHNSVVPASLAGQRCWLHRKGAAPSDAGPAVIPGSRGAPSYLVVPRDAGEASARSLAHGAGRKWTRSDARSRVRARLRPEQLVRTGLGSTVICEDRDLLYEEAPEAYKRIDSVIADLASAGLVSVLASFRPVITYKVRR